MRREMERLAVGRGRRGARMAASGMLAVALVLGGVAGPAWADAAEDSRELVAKSRTALENLLTDSKLKAMRDLIGRAKGVVIAPDVIRAAFVLGGSGGSAVLLARDGATGEWSEPAFVTIGSASFGFQAGVDVSEVALLLMTERGVTAMLGNTIKLGADVSLTAGPAGAGVAGATAVVSADIIAFSRAKGLYGGISLDGAVVAARDDWNRAYYGKPVKAPDILIRRDVSNPASAGLIQVLTTATPPR